MLKLTARVHKGRLTLDEPFDAPEGTEVDLAVIDAGDTLDDADRARLHELLTRSHDEIARGEGVDADELLEKLRAKRG